MTSDRGPGNLAFDFAEKGAEPLDESLTEDLTSSTATRPAAKLLLDVHEVGEALGCGKTYVYELIARGELRAVKLGRLTRIPAVTLAEFIRQLESHPSKPEGPSPDAPFTDSAGRNSERSTADAHLARRDGRRR
jgi:excisionase family DNA binding protein